MTFELMIHKAPPSERSTKLAKEAVTLVEALPHALELGEIFPGEGTISPDDAFYIEDLTGRERKEFRTFCEERGLGQGSREAASGFVDFKEGAALVLVTLKPGNHDPVAAFFSELVALALKHGWRIHNPQTGSDVDLVNPGRLPANY